MGDNNLAYRSEEYYDIPDSPLLKKKTTNTRTAGGVMIKIGKNKRIKLNTDSTSAKGRGHVSKGTVVSVIVLAAMAFLVLFRGLMIQSGYEQIEAQNAALAEVISENQKIQFKIDQTLDLKNIENVAKNTYNMGEPTKAQTVYINLDQAEEVKKVTGGSSFLDSVSEFFAAVVEYFS